jgi:hypothetical protein
MGSNTSSSSTSSSTPNDSDCYLRNKMIRQQCSQTRPDNEGRSVPPTQPYPSKLQLGCDCQGNVVECDENGRIIRVIKQNNR